MFYGELEGESDRLAENNPLKCETYYLQFGENLLIQQKREW